MSFDGSRFLDELGGDPAEDSDDDDGSGGGSAGDNITQGQAGGLMSDPTGGGGGGGSAGGGGGGPSPSSGGGGGGGSSGGGRSRSRNRSRSRSRNRSRGGGGGGSSGGGGGSSQPTITKSPEQIQQEASGGGGSGGTQQPSGPSPSGTSATVSQPSQPEPEPSPDPSPTPGTRDAVQTQGGSIDVGESEPAKSDSGQTEPTPPEKTADLGGVGVQGTDTRTADQARAEQIQTIEEGRGGAPAEPEPSVTEANIEGAPDAPAPQQDTGPATQAPSEPTGPTPTPPEAPRFEDQAAESGDVRLPTEPFTEPRESRQRAERETAARRGAAGADISRPAPGDRTTPASVGAEPTLAEGPTPTSGLPGDTRGTAEPDIPGMGPPGRAGAAARIEGRGRTPAAGAGLFVEDIFLRGPGTPDVTDVDERLRNLGIGAAAIATEGVVEDDQIAITGPEVAFAPGAFEGAAQGTFQAPGGLFQFTSGGAGEVDQDIVQSLFGSGGFLPEGRRELDAPPGQLANPFATQAEIRGLSDAEIREQFAAANPGVDPEDVTVGLGTAASAQAVRQADQGAALAPTETAVTTFGLDVDDQDIRERVAAFNPGVSAEDVEFTAAGEPIVTTGSGDVFQAAAGLIPGVPGAELSERALLQEAQRQQQRFSEAENVEAALGDFRPVSPFIDVGQTGQVGFRDEVVQFGAGAAGLPGELAALPATGVFGVEQGAEFAENIGGTVDEFGGVETAATVTEGGARIGAGVVEEAEENPFRFGGELGAELLVGAAAFSGVQRGARAVRSARIGGPETELDVISPPEQLSDRGLALFETPPGAPTDVAVRELREKAADQPEVLQEAFDVGEGSFIFRSESEPLRGDVEVQRGEFELEGLFGSPVASRIRLEEGGVSRGFPQPRLGFPRLRGGDEQVTLFPGERIEPMPMSARGAGFVVEDPSGEIVARNVGQAEGRRIAEEIGGTRRPDPEASGSVFLREQAEPGTAFVRPPGSRSTEMEAVFPVGTLFEEVGGFGVRRGTGDVIPGTAFRRVDVEAEDVGDIEDLQDAFEGELIPGSRVPETRLSRPRGDSDFVVPPGGIPGLTGPTATSPTQTGLFGGVTATTPTTTPTATGGPATTAPTTTGGVTDPSGLFTGPTTGGPFTEPPTTGGPTTGPPTAGGPTTSPPTTTGPTTAPPTPGPPTTGPPTPPPPTTTGIPTTPPSTPTSPGTPPPPPTTPLIPGVPGSTAPPVSGRPFLPDVPADQPEPEEEELFGPLGATFENPIMSAAESLQIGFAGFGEPTDLFGGGLFGEGGRGTTVPGTGASRPAQDEIIPGLDAAMGQDGDDGPIPNPFG